MKKYKAIIYDLDGTVLNTINMNMYPLIKIIKEETGEDWTFEQVLKFLPYPGMKVMEELQVADKEKAYARWVKYVNVMKKALLYTQGLKKFLKHLTEASFKQLLQQKQQHSIKLILLQKV